MQCRIATVSDIEGVLELQSKYHVSTISDDDKPDGFVTTAFTRHDLEKLITEEKGLHIVVERSKIIAYVMVASWEYWSSWPFFVNMINELHKITYLNLKLNTQNSYQYGPVCIDKQYRGKGVLKTLFEFSRKEMEKKYPILVTFINKINPRSYEAHVRKLGLEVIREFEYSNNNYYELVYDTSKIVE